MSNPSRKFTSKTVQQSSAAADASRKQQARILTAPVLSAGRRAVCGDDEPGDQLGGTAAEGITAPLMRSMSVMEGAHALREAEDEQDAAELFSQPMRLDTKDLCVACRSSHANLSVVRARVASGRLTALSADLPDGLGDAESGRTSFDAAAHKWAVADPDGDAAGGGGGQGSGAGAGGHATVADESHHTKGHLLQAMKFVAQIALLPAAVVFVWLLLPLESYWALIFARTVPYYVWAFYGWMLVFDILMPGMSRRAFVLAHVVATSLFCGYALLLRYTVDYKNGAWQLFMGPIETLLGFAWFTWHTYQRKRAGVKDAWRVLGACVLFKMGVFGAWLFVETFTSMWTTSEYQLEQAMVLLVARISIQFALRLLNRLLPWHQSTRYFAVFCVQFLFSFYYRCLFKDSAEVVTVAVLILQNVALDLINAVKVTTWFYFRVYLPVHCHLRRLLRPIVKLQPDSYVQWATDASVEIGMKDLCDWLSLVLYTIFFTVLSNVPVGKHYPAIISLPDGASFREVVLVYTSLFVVEAIVQMYISYELKRRVGFNTHLVVLELLQPPITRLLLGCFALHFMQDVFVGLGVPCDGEYENCSSVEHGGE